MVAGKLHVLGLRRGVVLSLAAVALLVTGCQASLPTTAERAPVPTESNAELCQYIAELPFVTADAAYRALYILSEGNLPNDDFEIVKSDLRSQGVLVADVEPMRFLDRSQIGRAVASTCGVKTGLNWQLTGLGRYAWRELQYERIVRTSGEYGYVSGGEFLGILARAEEYMQRAGDAGAHAELGQRPTD